MRHQGRGQSWFAGEALVHVVEFADEYNAQCDCAWCGKCRRVLAKLTDDDDKMTTGESDDDKSSVVSDDSSLFETHPREALAHEGDYLLISTQFIPFSMLERHGLRYKIATDSFVYLDPRLTWDDLAALVLMSHVERMHETARRIRQKKHELCTYGEVPPMSFFDEVEDLEAEADGETSDKDLRHDAKRKEIECGDSHFTAAGMVTGVFSAIYGAIRSVY